MADKRSASRGFKRTSTLLQGRVRKASEGRGFAQSRVLTHWAEIVGEEMAAITRPVDVKYGRGGFGATLSILTTGANAPLVDARREDLRAKINAVYGYNAIARVRVTQTAPTGFAEGGVDFDHRPRTQAAGTPPPEIARAAQATAAGVSDPDLKAALERLALNVISKPNRGTR